MTKVTYVHSTPEAEKFIAYCARVSNPSNQHSDKIEKLLAYCIKNAHWSVLEMANLCVEVSTTRAIAAQLLRHKSFSFQEFSQRYAEATEIEVLPARRQDSKNRQNSVDDLSDETKAWFSSAQEEIKALALSKYKEALLAGVAKEQARFLLPLSTKTKLYVNGTLRSWVHYIQLRGIEPGTQLEHKEIALQTLDIFKEKFPIVSKAMNWIS